MTDTVTSSRFLASNRELISVDFLDRVKRVKLHHRCRRSLTNRMNGRLVVEIDNLIGGRRRLRQLFDSTPLGVFKKITMRSSWTVGRLAGIDVSLHWSFLLLVGWILVASLGQGVGFALTETALVVALFGCVVLHELGHAMAARAFGIPTHGITLLPIGGVAELHRIPREPFKEWIIALAGPAVNVLIVGMLFPIVTIADGFWDGAASAWGNGWSQRLIWMNVSLVVFNLVPAFPMDGGRLLRSMLARRQPYLVATQIAVRVGQFVAVMLFVAGLAWNPMLMLVAAFVLFAANAELHQVKQEEESRSMKWPHGWLDAIPTGVRGEAGQPIGQQFHHFAWTLPNGVVRVQTIIPRARG